MFLGPGHRLVGGRAGCVIPPAPLVPGIATAGGGLLVTAGRAGAEVLLVVAIEGLLFVGVEVAGVGDLGGVLDYGFVERQDQVVTI